MKARPSSGPDGRATPNCVDCSRSVPHGVCSVLHLLDGGWVTEHGAHHGRLDVYTEGRVDPGKR
ncbi:MAG TPA: hypothetical protein VKV73_17060 [Chloroflexota bacterium]|nr:hypothetical protein [Chloroflexota bacterium]